jgi:hypothetical protein
MGHSGVSPEMSEKQPQVLRLATLAQDDSQLR